MAPVARLLSRPRASDAEAPPPRDEERIDDNAFDETGAGALRGDAVEDETYHVFHR